MIPVQMRASDLNPDVHAGLRIQFDSRCPMMYFSSEHATKVFKPDTVYAKGVDGDERVFWPIMVPPDTRVLVWLND